MILSIILRKEVADTAEAQTLLDFVADKVSPYPDVTVNGSCSETLELTPPPPP